jgi:hypothetical protein
MYRWSWILPLMAAACGGSKAPDPEDTAATDTPTDSPTDTPTDTPSDTPADTPTDTPEDTPPTDTARPDIAPLLPGTWRPTNIIDSGMPRPVPDDPASYYLLGADGSLAFGCGTAPIGTWTFDPNAPLPARGVVTVDFGVQVTWYVVSLDAQNFVFAEGGDLFEFTRATCP